MVANSSVESRLDYILAQEIMKICFFGVGGVGGSVQTH